MNKAPAFLRSSLELLISITNETYNDQIREVAIHNWQHHLQPSNPQWKYISAQQFKVQNNDGSAHVMAMRDCRLPEIGIVGYFACTNSKVGAEVLNDATEYLKAQGLKVVYGPINGTLPSDYRLNMKDDFCFPGEPVNPIWYLEAFHKAGFKTFNRYVSASIKHYQLVVKLVKRNPKKKYAHLKIRPYNVKEHNRDFKIYHELRNAIFPDQSIYCPEISLKERIYNTPGKFDPSYTFFLVDGKSDVGFIMAYVYNNQLVLKTIGLLPDYQGHNLSGLLIRPLHDLASKDGLEAVIYAMVRVGNRAYKMKRPGVKIIRKYITMYKNL